MTSAIHADPHATTTSPATPRRLGRSVAAVAIGFFSVAVFSLATDQVLHMLEVYPPWGVPMWETSLNLLALSYRMLFAAAGGYITAALAPHAPMRHVNVVAVLGLIGGTAGAIGAMQIADLGPAWYPILLAISAYPTVWLGGVLHGRRARG